MATALQNFIDEFKNQIKPENSFETIKEAQQMLGYSDNEVPQFLGITNVATLNDGFANIRLTLHTICRQQKISELTGLIQLLNPTHALIQLDKLTKSEQIGFEMFCTFREELAECNKLYRYILSATAFAFMPSAQPTTSNQRNKYIYRQDLLDMIEHTITALQHKIALEQLYCTLDNTIDEQQLQDYIQQRYSQYKNFITEEQEPFYICYCTKAIIFLLNARPQKIPIDTLVSSFYLEAALRFDGTPDCFKQHIFGPVAMVQAPSILTFSAFNEAYSSFYRAAAHTPENGGLLNEEGARALSFQPSQYIIKCMFYVGPLYNGCIDFRTYLDYMFALTFPSSPAAARYTFYLLDSQYQQGYLTRENIREIFASVYKDMEHIYSSVGVPAEDFVDEIFDSVRPQHNDRINSTDLARVGGEFFVRYLLSVQSLVEREAIAQNAIAVISDVPWSG